MPRGESMTAMLGTGIDVSEKCESLASSSPTSRRHSREALLNSVVGQAGIHFEAFNGCPLSRA
jgi:hypothetical protein